MPQENVTDQNELYDEKNVSEVSRGDYRNAHGVSRSVRHAQHCKPSLLARLSPYLSSPMWHAYINRVQTYHTTQCRILDRPERHRI